MPEDEYRDPAGNTEAFQAFARGTTAELPTPSRSNASITIAVVGAVIVVAAIVIVLLAI